MPPDHIRSERIHNAIKSADNLQKCTDTFGIIGEQFVKSGKINAKLIAAANIINWTPLVRVDGGTTSIMLIGLSV